MKSNRMLARIAFLMLIDLCAAAWAQDTASITGTITDPSGAAVPNAQVAVTELRTRHQSHQHQQRQRRFSLRLAAHRFLRLDRHGRRLQEVRSQRAWCCDVADKARVNVALRGRHDQHRGGGAGLGCCAGRNSIFRASRSTITGKEISQLELNGRDFTQLVALSPGVTNQSGADEGEPGASTVAFSVNGGRTEYNNFEVDGGDTQDNGSNTTLNVYPSIDAIAEVKVLTSNYGAQYGRNGSGTVEVETKSGTNAFHGDLYEFIRNDAFNATQFGATSVPAYKKHDFGFTIGGPVYIPGFYNTNKQKTFFFWSEEWRRELVPATNFFGTTAVPTMANRAGDFSDQCSVPNNSECPVVPAVINGVAQPVGNSPGDVGQPFVGDQVPIGNPTVANALTALIPQPNQSSGTLGNTLDQWDLPPTLPTHWRQELFKIDHNISDKVRANFRYIHDSWTEQYPVPLWTNGTSFPTVQTNFSNPGVSMVARLTANISPTLLNEFVASYTTDHISTNLTGPWQRPSNFPALGLYDNGFGGKVPGISVGDALYNFSEDPGYVPQGPLNSNPTFTYRDNLTKVTGNHNLQFGVYVVDAHKNEVPQPGEGVNGQLFFANTGNTVTSGNAYADLLLGNISSFTQEQNALKMHEQYRIYEAFFQDDWHATRRLTLNLGLRMSFYGTYSEKNNLAWNFDPAFYVPRRQQRRPCDRTSDRQSLQRLGRLRGYDGCSVRVHEESLVESGPARWICI